MFPREVFIDFYAGEIEEYPFDEHHALFEILVAEPVGADEEVTGVPTELDFLAYHHGYDFHDEPMMPSAHGYLGFDVHMSRSSLDVGIAVFWMVIIWGLTFVNVVLLVGVLEGHVTPNFSLFGYMSGFIVAVLFFRQMFPNIPPFLGIRSDFLSIFWALLIAAVIARVVGIKWLITLFKTEESKAID